jgi:predicted DsbA family dithiol-disulfide isomerase
MPTILVRRQVVFDAFLATLFALIALAACSGVRAAAADGQAQAGAPDEVVAKIGDQPVSAAELDGDSGKVFEQQRAEQQQQLRDLQLKFAAAQHELRQQQLDKLLDRRALELEARTRGVAPELVQKDIKMEIISDEAVRSFYDGHRDRIPQAFEQVQDQIRQYLEKQRAQEASRAFFDQLRAKYHIVALLDPFRQRVEPRGPEVGKADAPVTIVEFGDFECPFCQREEPTLRQLIGQYPGQLRLVFRNLPLTQLHPDAMNAALAGVCADRQGKFWPMHDAMYADGRDLALEGLKDTARRLGLDAKHFTDCLSDPATRAAIDADVRDAQALGLHSTPYFFVNGRPIDGGVPIEKFQSVIVEELAHSPGRSGAPGG